MSRRKTVASAPIRTPSIKMTTYLIQLLLLYGVGETVGVGEAGGGGGAEFMFVNKVRSTAAGVLVIASTCCRTCASGTLLNPVGTSNRLTSGSVLISRISATTFAPLTPCTLPLASLKSSARSGKPVSLSIYTNASV